MTALRSVLTGLLSSAIFHCFGKVEGTSGQELLKQIEIPPKPDLGDFAYPCIKLARQLRRPPLQIATALSVWLWEDEQKRKILATQVRKNRAMPFIQKVEIVGPYLNFTLERASSAEVVLRNKDLIPPEDDSQRIMVEFSQPNTHKVFHVGHMRNLCLGDALVRLLRAVGHKVIPVNYIGDMGVHISKCLWGLGHRAVRPAATPYGEWLGEVYTWVHLQLEDWKAANTPEAANLLQQAQAEIDELHHKLETKDPSILNLWLRTRQASLEAFEEIYRWAGVHFDHFYYESEMSEPSQELVEEYLAKGVFVESQGAVGIQNDEIQHMPFFLLRKRNREGLYATKDLALALRKFDEYKPDRSLYVVDVRQTDHFRHVFLALKKMGFEQADRCQHIPYEMVELPEGPMSARKGTIVLFRDLLEEMVADIRRNHLDFYKGDWSEEEIVLCANQVALGAIRYGMLNAGLTQRIVFNLDAWLQLKGNTGPYLQYTATRLGSILHKCAEEGKVGDIAQLVAASQTLVEPTERQLIMRLDEFSFCVQAAAKELRPQILCSYLHHLTQEANRFIQACPVKSCEGDLLQGRLLLVSKVHQVLTKGLDILGIPVPMRM